MIMKNYIFATIKKSLLVNFGIGSRAEEVDVDILAREEAINYFVSFTSTFIAENPALVANIEEFNVRLPSNPIILAIRRFWLHIYYWRTLREYDEWKKSRVR
jgi:hypothetical protein